MTWEELLERIPVLIDRNISVPDGFTVSAELWNELWNLSIVQGDSSEQAIQDMLVAINLQFDAYTAAIDNANTNADAAVVTADNAATLALQADGKADAAIVTADAAAVTANNADTKSDTAILDSSAALIAANAAETKADAAVVTANDAETAVANKADVAYVDQIANDFQLGEVMPDSILRTQLEPAVRTELDGLATDVGAAQDTADNAVTAASNAQSTADSKSAKYQGNANFPIASDTFQVNSATCTVNTLVDIYIQSESDLKQGTWEVEAFAGYFIITTDTQETSLINFEWRYEV